MEGQAASITKKSRNFDIESRFCLTADHMNPLTYVVLPISYPPLADKHTDSPKKMKRDDYLVMYGKIPGRIQ
jgi:hypothetical protein